VEELFIVDGINYYVPIDTDKSKVRQDLLKDLDYNRGFLKSVQAKLANDKFVANARPEVIAIEKKKESDALQKIRSIEDQLASL
jgi:valyl-tRNA synthetase